MQLHETDEVVTRQYKKDCPPLGSRLLAAVDRQTRQKGFSATGESCTNTLSNAEYGVRLPSKPPVMKEPSSVMSPFVFLPDPDGTVIELIQFT